MSEPIDLALGILDHQLVDAEGRRCGKVDDLELDLAVEPPRVTAIIVGTTAWRSRSRLGALAARLRRVDSVRIPWEEVASIKSAVQLKRTARELGLGRGDDRYRPLVERLGIGAPESGARIRTHDVVPWSAVVRADARGIVVRDGTEPK